MHPVSSFVTLTYEHLPRHENCRCRLKSGMSLCYPDFQRFMYRLRRRLGPTRFFMCGEYGEINARPHFHVLLFGRDFSDGPPCGTNITSSRMLSALWKFGFSSSGSVTYDSAAYVARYACSRVTGDQALAHYRRVDPFTGEVVQCVPEFGHMSLKPGIGFTWFQKYWRDVYVARDGVVRNGGHVVPSPRFYDKLLMDVAPDLREHKDLERYFRSAEFAADCTPDRLAVREKCAIAKAKFLKRDL